MPSVTTKEGYTISLRWNRVTRVFESEVYDDNRDSDLVFWSSAQNIRELDDQLRVIGFYISTELAQEVEQDRKNYLLSRDT